MHDVIDPGQGVLDLRIEMTVRVGEHTHEEGLGRVGVSGAGIMDGAGGPGRAGGAGDTSPGIWWLRLAQLVAPLPSGRVGTACPPNWPRNAANSRSAKPTSS